VRETVVAPLLLSSSARTIAASTASGEVVNARRVHLLVQQLYTSAGPYG
jgi:hypothetical protein